MCRVSSYVAMAFLDATYMHDAQIWIFGEILRRFQQ
jgi:hypothetical protein